MIAFAATLAYAGFTALCLTMARHHEQVFHRRSVPPGQRRLLEVAGRVLLGSSVLPLVQDQGWGLGLVLWPGILTATAIPLALLLTYAPRFVLGMVAAPLLIGLALL